MKPLLIFCAESVGGHRLVTLHKAHDHIAADEDQPLHHAVGRNDEIRIRQGLCRDIGERGSHCKTNLDDRRGDADGDHTPYQTAGGLKITGLHFDDGTAAQIEPQQNAKGHKLGKGGSEGSALHSHAKPPGKHEHRVQQHIQNRTDDLSLRNAKRL